MDRIDNQLIDERLRSETPVPFSSTSRNVATRSAAREWYEVDLLPSAARELDELPDAVWEEAHYLINALADAEPL